MPRLKGNYITIGSGPNTQTENYFYIDYNLYPTASTNSTYVTWTSGFKYTLADAELNDGDVVVEGTKVYDVPGRVKNFTSTFTTRDHQMTSGSFTKTHGTDGTASITFSGGVTVETSPRSSFGTQTITLENFNRTANTPSITSVTRTSTTNCRVVYVRNGSVNGPTTYILQRAIDADFTLEVTNYTNPETTVDIAVEANKTYYFRVYAYGDEGGNKFSSTSGPHYGQPSEPQSVSASQEVTANDRVRVNFSAPAYTGGTVQSYTITRNGTPSNTFTGVSSSPYYDTDAGLIPGNPYTYTISAIGSSFAGATATTGNVIATGTPGAPTAQPLISNVGLNMTIISASVSGNGGVAIDFNNASQGYFVQYQLADTLNGSYGYGGTVGAWSPAVKMSDQANRTHTYSSMTPAKFYKFRTYAANSVTKASNNITNIAYPHNNALYVSSVNFATNTTGYFLAAGGKRYSGTGWIATATAKRYDGTNWVPLTIAKRYDGTTWVPLS